MARLDLPQHPDRIFKDDFWQGYPSASGYRSLGTTDDPTAIRFGSCEAFAVVWDLDRTPLETKLFVEIVNLQHPFVAAEICRLSDGTLCAIGFYFADAIAH